MKRVILLLLAAGAAPTPGPVKPAPGDAVPWQPIFKTVAGGRWIDRAAQVQAESAFNPQAKSPVGARGGAQFMPNTWKEWAKPPTADPTDPGAFIPAQHRYMLWIEARVGGALDPALGGYNAGLGSVLKAQRLAATLGLPGPTAWLQALPRVTVDAHAKETQGYIVHNATFRARIRAKVTP